MDLDRDDPNLVTALALGQDPALIEAIRRGEIHSAMAAFGLWNDLDLDALEAQVYAHRESRLLPSSSEPRTSLWPSD